MPLKVSETTWLIRWMTLFDVIFGWLLYCRKINTLVTKKRRTKAAVDNAADMCTLVADNSRIIYAKSF